MAKLWKIFNYGKGKNEPFLINAPKRLTKSNPVLQDLMIVNKPKRGGVKKMARRKRASGRKHRLTLRGRRISPISRLAPRMAGTVVNPFAGLNPRRRKRRSIRRYRRNPALALPLVGRIMIPDVMEIAGGVGGFIAVKSIPQMVFPATWQVGIMRPVSQGLTAIGTSLIANRFLGKKVGKMVLYGGLIAMASELVGQLLVKAGLPLGYYLQPQDMSYYMTKQEQTY